MIAGLSGSMLSHDALQSLAAQGTLGIPERGGCGGALRTWHARVREAIGPTASARTVFDVVGQPLLERLGYGIGRVRPGRAHLEALALAGSAPCAVLVTSAWGRPLRALWGDAIRAGLAQRVRWAVAVNGPALAIFDVERPYARRSIEFDLAATMDEESARSLFCCLVRPEALRSAGEGTLVGLVKFSDEHRGEVRRSLRHGVHTAVMQLVAGFRRVVSSRTSDAQLLDESLTVVYRFLFLLFAEARGLVPSWHRTYRDAYTIDGLRRQLERGDTPTGVWESFQAVSRLAHRGCRAGTLRVQAFNGRLFSPAYAPLAARAAIDDTVAAAAVLALTTRTGAGGRRAISYADLGVEQLGGVYEHLLDFDVESRVPAPPRLVPTGRRKATGSFYTPRVLTDFVVRRALAPLVRDATPERILALRVVDPAMGSGAFLVAACRYLATAYEQALVREGVLGPDDITYRDRADFRRAVAQRCLFGVDINPMAVQLARLSMWLSTMAAEKPLTFLDHRLRAGNSLVGASIADVMRHPRPGRTSRRRDLPLFDEQSWARSIQDALTIRRQLETIPDDRVEQVREKERALAALQKDDGPLVRWREAADVWCAAWFDAALAQQPGAARAVVEQVLKGDGPLPEHVLTPLRAAARVAAARQGALHWTLEFPEVFFGEDGAELPDGGFDVVLGNPPWDMLREERGRSRERDLSGYVAGSGQYSLQGRGHANLYQLFFERGLRLLRPGGRCAVILPAGFATDQGCAALRRHLLERTRVDTFTIVQNRDGIFPIHRSLKFVILTCQDGVGTQTLPLRTGVRAAEALEQVPDTGAGPETLAVPRALLERLSGAGLEIPELRSEVDLAIVSRLAPSVPPCSDPDGWHVHFGRELNATEDRPHLQSGGPGLPVIEGKQLRAFGVDIGSSRFRIARRTAARLLDEPSTFGRARLCYRDVASPANRTTLIAAIVPAGCVTTHTVFCLKEGLAPVAQAFLCGVFNSFVANYLVRMRVNTHVTAGIVGRLPVPRPAPDDGLFRGIAAGAEALAVAWELTRAADLEAQVAQLYGLSPAEFEHVLSTFPLVDAAHRQHALRIFQERCTGMEMMPQSQPQPLDPPEGGSPSGRYRGRGPR